jgi:hypothetical protein
MERTKPLGNSFSIVVPCIVCRRQAEHSCVAIQNLVFTVSFKNQMFLYFFKFLFVKITSKLQRVIIIATIFKTVSFAGDPINQILHKVLLK